MAKNPNRDTLMELENPLKSSVLEGFSILFGQLFGQV